MDIVVAELLKDPVQKFISLTNICECILYVPGRDDGRSSLDLWNLDDSLLMMDCGLLYSL
jgi:hypothetical protein